MKTAEEMGQITMDGIADRIMEAAGYGESSTTFSKLNGAMEEYLKELGYNIEYSYIADKWTVEW